MALTKSSGSNTIYLQAKHYSLWREIKQQVDECETVQVTNPKTGVVSNKFGYRYDSVTGHVVDVVWYDTEKKYPTRYFGFKMHIQDGTDKYVLDMPFNSQFLRRFLKIAPSVDWTKPLSITVFKGRKKDSDAEEMAVWFRQNGETLKQYFTRDQPHGMPEATFDDVEQKWDFKAQHRWLTDRLKNETIPAIQESAKRIMPPVAPHPGAQDVDPETPPFGENDDEESVPF